MCKKPYLLLLTPLLLSLASPSFGQNDALVLLQPAGADKGACSTGVAEPGLVTIRDFKIGGKSDIRLAGQSVTPSPTSSITRERFNQMRKVKLKDMAEVEVRDGLLYAATGEGAKTLAVPDVEPGKGSAIQLGQYSGMQLEGDLKEGKSKQKKV